MQAAIAEAADGYSIPSGTTQTISEHGICRRVTNAIVGGHGLFVPTRSLMEWANNPVSFLSNTIPGVSLAACLDAMSVRFRNGASASLTRVIPATSNRTTWTWSGWVKRGSKVGTDWEDIYCAKLTGVGYPNMCLSFIDSDRMRIWSYTGSAFLVNKYTVRSFRDPAAWYHVVLTVDTTNATAEDRVRLYINGLRVTSFSTNTNPSQSASLDFNVAGYNNTIGGYGAGGGGYFDGHMADIHFIDGQALEPAAFAETDPATGQWVPKPYAGTYGTNGFRLDFGNVASLGADTSGNNNNWTPNNFSTTPGPTNDAMMDASYPVTVDGNTVGNYATFNPLPIWGGFRSALSNGNLTAVTGSNVQGGPSTGSIAFPSAGKWYFEVSLDSGLYPVVGIQKQNSTAWADGAYWSGYHGRVYRDSDGGTVISSIAVNDVVGVAVDSDAGQVAFYKNGVLQLSLAYNRMVEGDFVPYIASASSGGSAQFTANFGQRAFAHTPPTGFAALNTFNLPPPAVVTPSAYFNTVTYTGNGSFQQIGTPPALTGGASIAHSARFRAESSAYMTRTPGAGNRRIWTWSGWVKRSGVDSTQSIFSAYGGSGGDFLYFNSDNSLRWYALNTDFKRTTRRFRDEGQWSHIVLAVDTTNATAADRYRIFVDGLRITAFSMDANPSLNFDSSVNSAVQHELGRYAFNGCCTFNGYFADVHFVDGQSLDASSFGQFNSADVWVPITYAGSYGTNGYRLNFGNSAALGADSSGNGNNWTVNNIAATDQVADTPTRAFQTWNPLDRNASMGLSNGNLTTVPGGAQISVRGAMPVSSGKWYWEMTQIGSVAGNHPIMGVADAFHPLNVYPGNNGSGNGWAYYGWNGNKFHNTAGTAYGVTFAQNDTIGVALDMDDGKIWFSKNGVWMASGNPATGTNAAFTNLAGHTVMPIIGNGTPAPGSSDWNFGQGGKAGLTYYPAAGGSFLYAPPTGFKAMSTEHISSTDFVPDLAIIKSRSAATDWAWYDRERGATLDIASNLTSAETAQSGGLLGFNAGGFNVGNLAKVNTSGANYIAYLFKKGVTPGFDIVTYVGSGGNQNIPHGLGQVPAMFVTKALGAATYPNWISYHQSMSASPHLGAISLNATSAYSAGSGFWNDTAPTTSNFRVGSLRSESGMRYVAYLFAEVPGFSKFGRYTGNGSADGPFVHTGFKPAFVMMKRIDSTENWVIKDGARQGYNPHNDSLYPNLANAEGVDSQLDLLSNGFKLRNTNAGGNVSGGTYIYAAFAESPFKYSNAR